MSEYWDHLPLNLLILQILERRDGIILENELLSLIEQEINYRPGIREFNRILMKLEIHGKILITNIKKNQKHIKLIREEQNYLAIGED